MKRRLPDYLAITPENKDQPLTATAEEVADTEHHFPVTRGHKQLRHEYFAYEVLNAVGLFAPRLRIGEHVPPLTGKSISLQTRVNYNPFETQSSIPPDAYEKKGFESHGCSMRLDPSLTTYYLGESIVQDTDSHDAAFVRMGDRYALVELDKELASTRPVDPTSFAENFQNMKEKYHLDHDQVCAAIDKMQALIAGDPSPLHQIFYNSRVEQTDILKEGRDELYDAWLRNINEMLQNPNLEPYVADMDAFRQREAIRQELALKVIDRVNFDDTLVSKEQLVSNLTDDLRAGHYWPKDGMNAELLNDEHFLEFIMQNQYDRVRMHEEQAYMHQFADDVVVYVKQHCFPQSALSDRLLRDIRQTVLVDAAEGADNGYDLRYYFQSPGLYAVTAPRMMKTMHTHSAKVFDKTISEMSDEERVERFTGIFLKL